MLPIYQRGLISDAFNILFQELKKMRSSLSDI